MKEQGAGDRQIMVSSSRDQAHAEEHASLAAVLRLSPHSAGQRDSDETYLGTDDLWRQSLACHSGLDSMRLPRKTRSGKEKKIFDSASCVQARHAV